MSMGGGIACCCHMTLCFYCGVVFAFRCYKVLDAVLHTLGDKCRRLRTLVMDGCYKITDDGLCKVGLLIGC